MNTPVAPVTRSAWVTIIGALVLVLGVIGALKVLLLLAVVHAYQDVNTKPGAMSALLGLMAVRLVVAAVVVYAACAFINRRNWARIAFIVFFWLCIAANLTFIGYFLLSRKDLFGPYGLGLGALFAWLAIFAVGFIVLFWAIVRHLRSPPVQAEFGVHVPAPPAWWERQSRP
jgi:hypothetical protein